MPSTWSLEPYTAERCILRQKIYLFYFEAQNDEVANDTFGSQSRPQNALNFTHAHD
jgi:hypothetical protein